MKLEGVFAQLTAQDWAEVRRATYGFTGMIFPRALRLSPGYLDVGSFHHTGAYLGAVLPSGKYRFLSNKSWPKVPR